MLERSFCLRIFLGSFSPYSVQFSSNEIVSIFVSLYHPDGAFLLCSHFSRDTVAFRARDEDPDAKSFVVIWMGTPKIFQHTKVSSVPLVIHFANISTNASFPTSFSSTGILSLVTLRVPSRAQRPVMTNALCTYLTQSFERLPGGAIFSTVYITASA